MELAKAMGGQASAGAAYGDCPVRLHTEDWGTHVPAVLVGGQHEPHHSPRFSLRRAPTPCSTFAANNKLKRQAMKVIASTMPADEIAGLREIFKSIDADSSGACVCVVGGGVLPCSGVLRAWGCLLASRSFPPPCRRPLPPTTCPPGLHHAPHSQPGCPTPQTPAGTITAEELKAALEQKGSLLKQEELRGLLALIDQDASGTIDYEVGLQGAQQPPRLVLNCSAQAVPSRFAPAAASTAACAAPCWTAVRWRKCACLPTPAPALPAPRAGVCRCHPVAAPV